MKIITPTKTPTNVRAFFWNNYAVLLEYLQKIAQNNFELYEYKKTLGNKLRNHPEAS